MVRPAVSWLAALWCSDFPLSRASLNAGTATAQCLSYRTAARSIANHCSTTQPHHKSQREDAPFLRVGFCDVALMQSKLRALTKLGYCP